MVESVSYDTTFLIDLQREKRLGTQGRAHEFLRAHSEAVGFVSVVALGEFMEGFPDASDPRLRRLIAAFQVLEIDALVSEVYAENVRRLRASGRLIGSNDLWIGSCSVRYRVPLLTRNVDDFSRIAGLEVVGY